MLNWSESGTSATHPRDEAWPCRRLAKVIPCGLCREGNGFNDSPHSAIVLNRKLK